MLDVPVQSHPTHNPGVWPLPSFNGRAPVIVDPAANCGVVDLAYAHDDVSDLVTTNGRPAHFMPSKTTLPFHCPLRGLSAQLNLERHLRLLS